MLIGVVLALLVSSNAGAVEEKNPTASEACMAKLAELSIHMKVIKSNIDNLNTTRTPDGGPYRARHFVCRDQTCELVIEDREPLMVYEPQHPDAKADGYVAYPNIDLMAEMETYIALSKNQDSVGRKCFANAK